MGFAAVGDTHDPTSWPWVGCHLVVSQLQACLIQKGSLGTMPLSPDSWECGGRTAASSRVPLPTLLWTLPLKNTSASVPPQQVCCCGHIPGPRPLSCGKEQVPSMGGRHCPSLLSPRLGHVLLITMVYMLSAGLKAHPIRACAFYRPVLLL